MIGYKPSLPQLSAELRAALVNRIITAVDPDKIVLFGSRAEESHRPESDIDLIVVRDSTEPFHKRAIPIYAALADLPIEVDVDILVYTPEEIEEWRGASAALVTTALRQGRTIYERQR